MARKTFKNSDDAIFGLLAAIIATNEVLIANHSELATPLVQALKTVQKDFAHRRHFDAASVIGLVLGPMETQFKSEDDVGSEKGRPTGRT